MFISNTQIVAKKVRGTGMHIHERLGPQVRGGGCAMSQSCSRGRAQLFSLLAGLAACRLLCCALPQVQKERVQLSHVWAACPRWYKSFNSSAAGCPPMMNQRYVFEAQQVQAGTSVLIIAPSSEVDKAQSFEGSAEHRSRGMCCNSIFSTYWAAQPSCWL